MLPAAPDHALLHSGRSLTMECACMNRRNRDSPITGSYWDVLATAVPLMAANSATAASSDATTAAAAAAASSTASTPAAPLGASPPSPPPPPPRVAMLGLAGGTSARIIRRLWPHVRVDAWELDGRVSDVALPLW